MLLAPFVVGVLLSEPTWVHVPVLVAALAGYSLVYFTLVALKARRAGRYRSQIALYSAIALPAAAVSLVACPGLAVLTPQVAVLLGVNAWFAWRRNERSILNDLAATALACLMAPVAAIAGGADAGAAWPAAGVLLLYFGGTAFYVKTMIRERGSAPWLRASITVHAFAAVIAWLVAWPLGVAFTWLAVRAAWFPRFGLRPRTVGLVEIAHSVALVALVVASG